jgi:hypothetical protein
MAKDPGGDLEIASLRPLSHAVGVRLPQRADDIPERVCSATWITESPPWNALSISEVQASWNSRKSLRRLGVNDIAEIRLQLRKAGSWSI